MSMFNTLFYLMGVITLASALYVAVSQNLVRSIFMFFITLFGLAGLYVFALADFVAITQIVIYVGGILVLIVFAFMLSGRQSLDRLQSKKESNLSLKNLPAAMLAGLFMVVIVNVIIKAMPDNAAWIGRATSIHNVIDAKTDTTGNIGVNLMTHYLLPFEVVSVLLLMVLAGAAHLARKEGEQ